MKLHDCYGDNLLRMETPSPEKAKKALEIAYERTTRGKALLEKDFFEESLICCYTAMFQAARALLFREGIIEKSHACVNHSGINSRAWALRFGQVPDLYPVPHHGPRRGR
jgi:hypothetical protein